MNWHGSDWYGNGMALVIGWNMAHPPGTPVMLVDDHGQEHSTETRSSAWLTGAGDPLVSVRGRTGGYSLWRITAKSGPARAT